MRKPEWIVLRMIPVLKLHLLMAGRVFIQPAMQVKDAAFADNVRKVLKEMQGIEDRRACFRCAICLIYKVNEYIFEGRVEGEITQSPSGADGFGYDPVFRPDKQSQTFAEMPPYLKNGLSHRGRAVQKMLQYLNRLQ